MDSKYDPREGNLIAVGGGLGVVLNTGEPYTRARLRGQKWWPIGRRDVLTVRGEVGRIWANGKVQVPDDFGFRTGGARSIRGYKYQSIGLKRNSAIVGAPAMVVGSVEYDHYFNERWGMGVFVDAGDAAKSFGDMSLAVGYGVGARAHAGRALVPGRGLWPARPQPATAFLPGDRVLRTLRAILRHLLVWWLPGWRCWRCWPAVSCSGWPARRAARACC